MRVLQSTEQLLMGKYRLRFLVELSYTRYADAAGTSYNLVCDAMADLQLLAITELTSNWGGLVANGLPQTNPPSISVIDIAGETAFKADYNYTAFICNI